MEVRIRVRELCGERVRLAADTGDRCGLCANPAGCGCRLLGASNGGLEVPRCSRPGRALAIEDIVVVSMADREILQAAAAAYLVPTAGLLTGAAIARWFGGGEAIAFAAALAGALAGVWRGRRLFRGRFRVWPSRADRSPDG